MAEGRVLTAREAVEGVLAPVLRESLADQNESVRLDETDGSGDAVLGLGASTRLRRGLSSTART
jgi:hypothetical protein